MSTGKGQVEGVTPSPLEKYYVCHCEDRRILRGSENEENPILLLGGSLLLGDTRVGRRPREYRHGSLVVSPRPEPSLQ